MKLVWLFDIDGTLLLTDGAAREAFGHAVRDVLGFEDAIGDIAFAGRIEPLIVADILRKHSTRFEDGQEARFWESVFGHMRRLLVPGRGRLMPGVNGLLDAIEGERDWALGLLTGNMTEMAGIKLRHFGLDGRFAFGGFGEQASDRNELARLTVARVREHYGVAAERCIVVGDTEHDIACARAAGARVIAVATGGTARAELEAHGPDVALDDLSQPEPILRWARELAG